MAAVPSTHPISFPGHVDDKAIYAAEQDIIAACVESPDLLNRTALDPVDFTIGPNRQLWESLLALHAEGEEIDRISVAQRLEESGNADAVAYLWELVANCITSNFEHKAKLVFKRSQTQRFWNQVERAYKNRDESEIVRIGEDIQSRLQEGARRSVQSDIGVAVQSMRDEWAASKERAKFTWGLPACDRHFKPLEPTRLYVPFARPGVGKTAFALHVALANALKGKRVGFFSLEQSMEELSARLLCNLAQAPIEWIKGEDSPPAPDVQRIQRAQEKLSGLPLIINDATPMTISQLKGWARSLVQRHGCEMLIVDYVQKVGGDRSQQRYMEVAHVVMGLKDIARQHKVPVIALAQANRDSEGKRPGMSDIRDSGFIEQEADVIIGLHRELDEDTGERSRDCELLLLKNRHGQGDLRVTTFYRGEYFRFEERERRYAG